MSIWRRLRGRGRATEEPAGPSAPPAARLAELDDADRAIVERAWPHTMTSVERLAALIDAVRHCERSGLAGDFAECGVWRGGSVLAMILTLQELGAERTIHLFDTFEGMTRPTEHDVSRFDDPALAAWDDQADRFSKPGWEDQFGEAVQGVDAVRRVLTSTGYPADRLRFVRGPVEETLPHAAPDQLALLRLDTDWYESTRHELVHLYPRLVAGGILIVDDYGHWEGCRRAVDEYFGSEAAPVLLHRIDYTARLAIKAEV